MTYQKYLVRKIQEMSSIFFQRAYLSTEVKE